MKIGMCLNMNPARPDGTGLESLELVKSAGYDYVEVPSAQLMALEDSALEDAVSQLQACGVPVYAMNNLFQAGVRLTGPAVDDGVVDAYMDRLFDVAGRLGIKRMVFGSSGARNVPMNFPQEEAWRQILHMLSRLGPRADAIGCTVVIEHLNHLESNIIDWFGEGVRLVNELNHPAVRCLVDFYHLDLGNENLEPVEQAFDLIRHAHFANVLGRTMPTPDLHEPRGVAFLRFLKEKKYAHGISVEGYTNDVARDFVESLRFMRANLG